MSAEDNMDRFPQQNKPSAQREHTGASQFTHAASHTWADSYVARSPQGSSQYMSSDFLNAASVFMKQHWEDGDKWCEPAYTDHQQQACATLQALSTAVYQGMAHTKLGDSENTAG